MHCVQCGGALPDGAAFCPKCGRNIATPATKPNVTVQKQPATRGNSCLIIAMVVVGLIVLAAIISPSNKNTAPSISDPVVNDFAAVDATSNSAVVSEAASPWSYTQDDDKVRGTTTYYATTSSTNSIHQDFPYEAETTMTMTVRKSSAYGTDVILTVSSGQMMCPSYEGCSGTVRFDSGPAERVSFNGPEDNSSETVFVTGAKAFIGKLKRAKKVTIEKTLYQAGSPQFEFDVGGLKWDH